MTRMATCLHPRNGILKAARVNAAYAFFFFFVFIRPPVDCTLSLPFSEQITWELELKICVDVERSSKKDQ